MKLCVILAKEGKHALLPRGLAELLVRHHGTEAEFLFSAVHSTGHWSAYLRLPSGSVEHVVGVFDADGWRLGMLGVSWRAAQGCRYDLPDCQGPLWTCGTCGEQFCEAHATESGECSACAHDALIERAVDVALLGGASSDA